MTPGRAISGNGNPAIILWFLEIPCYLLLLAGIFILIRKEQYFAKGKAVFPFVFLLLFGLSLYLQYIHAIDIYKTLNNLIDRFGVINQYTNTVFINYYSFFSGIFGLLSIFQRYLPRAR
ncbi:hypothetical protein [Paenibacillus baekrokdamisoli]|nr:hypothetical protein [Paenibacillus baekrokdamisoli]